MDAKPRLIVGGTERECGKASFRFLPKSKLLRARVIYNRKAVDSEYKDFSQRMYLELVQSKRFASPQFLRFQYALYFEFIGFGPLAA